MATPPIDYQFLTQAEMNQKFVQENWQIRCANFIPEVHTTDWDAAITRRDLTRERKTKYRDADGNTRIVIIDYTRQDGSTSQAVRCIRDDAGVKWDVA